MAGDGFGTCHAGQMMGCGLPSEELGVSWVLLLQHLPLCCSLPTYLLVPGQSLLGQVEFGVCGGSVGPLASGKPAVQVLPIVLPRKQEGEVRWRIRASLVMLAGGLPRFKHLILEVKSCQTKRADKANGK